VTIPREDHRPVLIAFGAMCNIVVGGIVVLAVESRPIPEVLEFLALTLASQLGGAMIALGFRPTAPPPTPETAGSRKRTPPDGSDR
jgi:hypothetical protein